MRTHPKSLPEKKNRAGECLPGPIRSDPRPARRGSVERPAGRRPVTVQTPVPEGGIVAARALVVGGRLQAGAERSVRGESPFAIALTLNVGRGGMRTRAVPAHALACGTRREYVRLCRGIRGGNPWRSRSKDREARRRSTRPGGRALSGADAVRTPGLVRQDRGLAPSLGAKAREGLRAAFGAARATASPDWGVGCQTGGPIERNGME